MATAPDKDVDQEEWLSTGDGYKEYYFPSDHDYQVINVSTASENPSDQPKDKLIQKRKSGFNLKRVVGNVVHAGGDFISNWMQGKPLMYTD